LNTLTFESLITYFRENEQRGTCIATFIHTPESSDILENFPPTEIPQISTGICKCDDDFTLPDCSGLLS